MKNFSINKFNISLNFVHIFSLILLLPFCSIIYGQTGWVKQSDPVLDVGNPGEWDDELVGLPDIIFDGNTYHMWYTGYDGTYARIGYATSPDGITWTKYGLNPVLDIGDPTTWDDTWAYGSRVVIVDTVYHMWYIGNDGLANEYVGHATSPDGINWTRDPENPVLDWGPLGSWDDSNVSVSFISFESDTFHMWYDGTDGTYYRSGYATATDPNGQNWTKYTNNPVLDIGPPGSWDFPRAQCGSIVFFGGTFYMYYSGGDYFTWQIGFATAPDRVNWSKDPSNPDFTVGPPGSWDDYFVSHPYVLSTASELKMWYMGGTGILEGKIGYATAPPLPVELTSFTAVSRSGKVILNWSTASEINNLGFEVERKIFNNQNIGEWVRIGFTEGHGTTTEPKEYSYSDDVSTIQASSIAYRLKQIDYDGSYEYSDEVLVDNPAPVDYTLKQNYPNPFNPATTISYSLPIKSQVELVVYNALGESVMRLVNEEKEAGSYKIEFNATGLPSGVYFYKLDAGNYQQVKKMILMK